MFESKNIKDYVAKAVVLKEELPKFNSLKDRFARFTYLFPTNEDKMICKAIFDVIFVSDIKVREFVSQMVDGANQLAPQKVSALIDSYNQACALVYNMQQKDNKMASENGGERLTEEEKQGSSKNDNKHGRESDPFIVMNASDPNREFVGGGDVIFKKGQTVVAKISTEELEREQSNQLIMNEDKRKQDELKAREEEEKRRAYEKSLAERRQKKQYAKVASELERVYKNS